MGRCRGVPFEFPNILIRLLSSPRRAGGRTNKMNTNYLNTNYKSNERALADLLGQLVRGRNSSPSSYNRGGGGGGGGGMGGSGMSGGGGGPMNNYSGSSIGGGGGGGSGGWGGNQSNDWNQGSGVGGGGGFGNAGGSGNLMPLMQRDVGMNMNNSGGGGFGGMSQGGGFGGMTDNFGMQQGNSYMGMSGGNSGGFGGMQQNVGMNNGGFGGGGGGGFPQNNNFGGDGYGDCPPLPAIRSRGTWVTGSASRSSRNAPTSQGRSSRNAPTPQGRSSNRPTSSTQDRRSLGGSKASLSSRSIRSGGGAASGNSSKPEQAQKRKAPPSSVPPAKISNNASNAKPTSAQVNKTTSAEPRRVLTSVGGRWYQHFLTKGLKPEEARKKAFENNNKPFTVGVQGAASKNKSKSTKKPSTPPADKYVRLAIFAKGFPETMLDPEDLSSLEEMIVEEIANNSTETKLQFERLLRKPGMIFVDCVNQQTADWLKDLIPKLPHWENPELEVCSEDDIPRDAYIMILSLPNSAGQEYDQTLAIIQAQNADLVTDSWEWVHEREDGDRLTLTIRVDEESYTAIKEKKWKIFYKFNVVDVSFVRYIRYALQKQLNEESAVTTNKDESKANEQQPTDESDKTEMAVDLTEEAEEENQPSPPPAPVISK